MSRICGLIGVTSLFWCGYSFQSGMAAVIPLVGEPVEGRVVSIDEAGVHVEGASDPLAINRILRVVNDGVSVSEPVNSAAVFLVGGGRVPVRSARFDPDNEVFAISVEGSGDQELAVDVVAGVLLNPEADATLFHEVRGDPTTDFDRFLIDVGAEIQIIRGFLNELGDGTVSVEVEGELREFPLDRVTGIVLASIPVDARESWVEVVAANGSIFEGESVSLEAGSVMVALGAGDPLKLPWTGVARIEFFSPKISFLSDSQPVSSSTSPIVSLPRSPQLGTNVLGGNLRLRGRSFRRGVGMPGGSVMTFRSKGFDRFRSTAGIDDAAGERGDCVIVVRAGDEELFRSRIRGGETPVEVNVGLGGTREISLEVLPGENLDLADFVNWGDAVLIRNEE